jgi:hypothetical protein
MGLAIDRIFVPYPFGLLIRPGKELMNILDIFEVDKNAVNQLWLAG